MSAPSQSNGEDAFSLRIVTLDYYMSPPIPDLDFSYSSFQGRSVEEVPVIRIYGSTPAGQKACLHIHQALPYLYIPCPDNALKSPEEGQKFVHILSNALEKALKYKGSSTSKRQHVHECCLVRAKKLYGYYPSDDLFIKIYLYYPHEVGRAASILLDGAVLSTTFQPHESHIPYLLQFLVDYNLYGMGHIHLSKFKFRPPVPDAYIPTVPCFQRHGLQAHRGSAVWLSSTVQSDIIWPESSIEGGVGDKSNHLFRRQSICALEVDASVNDILNEKCKMYTSLSQTRAEVKMVQSLVPIWEEEYERSGIPDAVPCPDSCKPTPENVLGCFNHGLKYEKALIDLYMRIDKIFPSQASAIEEDGDQDSPTSCSPFQEPLKSSNERNKNAALPCRPFSQERENATLSEMCRNAEMETLDTEALGLLRWLASSQAAVDVTVDDDLTHEAILSPILSAKSYKEALELATLDYESASQQECQDILDSLEGFHGTEGSTGQLPHSTDQDLTISTSSGNVIPQVDGSFDDDLSTHLKGHLSEANMTSGREKYSVHQVERCSSTGSSKKQKRNKLLWGPLPLSFKQEEQKSSELACFASPHDQDMKSDCESSFSSGSKTERCCDTALKTYDEKGELAALNSVRDLMRRKRCLRTEQLDTVVKNIEIMDLCTEELIHHKSESEICTVGPQECPTIKSCSMAQDSMVREKLSHSKTCIHCVHTDGDQSVHCDLCSPTNQMSSISFLRNQAMQSNMPPDEKLHLQQEAANGGCVEAYTESQGFAQKSTALFVENLNVDGLEYHKFNKQLFDGPLEEKMGICKRNLTTINVEQPVMHDTKEHKNHLANEITEHINSPLNRDLYTCNNLSKVTDTSGYVQMTFSRRPPSRDELCKPSEDSAGIMGHAEDSAYINTGRQREDDVLPFFSRKFEDGKLMKLLNDENLIFHQERALGVPIHFQNDGSVLYLLTHAFSPPTLESVGQWLLEGMEGDHLNVSAGDACDEVSANTSDSHCLKPDLSSPASIRVMETENHDSRVDISSTGKQGTDIHFKGNVVNKDFHDLSQISGPYREDKSGLTPLSQTGFRDPASIGGGQQLTVLSMEVLAESRGDLLPDPKVDAINVISLAIQEDSNHAIEVHILMRCNSDELFRRHVDGVSNCQFSSFNDEKLLLDHFVGMITSFDPDILMGWEIQGGSLGFLAERAAHFGVYLLKKISRVPSHETKFKASDLANPEPSNEQNMMLVSDTVPEVSIIEDEWGRMHASGIHVSGRIVLNIWRLMRAELNLNMYSVEAVAEEVLRCKIPSISNRVLNNWFLSGPGRARYRCIEYVIERAKLNLEIMNQLDMINRTSELARVFGIDFFSVLSRGSQFRVESMLLRLAHTQNYLAISPGNQQVASQPAMECLPLVMEPESGFYADPVVVLDFQALYPSMIIAYNLCYSTCLGTVVSSKANILGVTSYLADPLLLKDLKQELLLTPNGIMYVSSKVRRGVLPRLLEEILSTRIMVKKAMKNLEPSQKVLQRIFNARQLALKLIANVTYGYTAAGFSGRMPCAELADSIVQCGRRTLETAISFVNQHDKWKARVVYGDTDSMFVLLKGRSREEAFRIGNEIASAITSMNPDPVTLKMEKVYHPCFLLTKKRYVGYSYEAPDQEKPIFDAKGTETVRRDTCPAVGKTLERSIRLFFEHQDISAIKTYLQRQWRRILSGKVSLQDFVFSKEVRLGTYSSRASTLPPAAIVATKAMQTDPRAEPRYGERIPYVVIHGEPGARLVDMVISPYVLLDVNSTYRLNELYYIKKQIIPALQRVFGLVGADLNQWFSDVPRPVRPTLAKRRNIVPRSESSNEIDSDIRSESSKMLPSKRSRIDTYYISKHCTLCGKLAQASAYLCDQCSMKESLVAAAIIGNTSKLEREIQHLVSICRHCGGGDWIIDGGVKCTSLACSVFYERRKIQKELQATSSFATAAEFYPRCMVEWF